MSSIEAILTALLSVSLPITPARAQEPRTTAQEVVAVTARVDRIDRSSRSLTLRTPEGVLHTVYVGPEVKMFDEVKLGDTLKVRIVDSVVVAVRPNATPKVVTDTTAEARKENADNRGEVQQQLKMIVTIESVDAQKQMVVYKTADNRSVMRAVSDPHLLEGLKRGDLVEVTFTRERAIELTRER
jgi:hypothetical protein